MVCLTECDREASIMRRPWPTRGCCATGKVTAGKISISVKKKIPYTTYIRKALRVRQSVTRLLEWLRWRLRPTVAAFMTCKIFKDICVYTNSQ
jgi:hypothetical protein